MTFATEQKVDPAFAYWCLCLLKYAIGILDSIVDFFTGRSILRGTKAERKKANHADKSAQLVNIRWRAALNWHNLTDLSNFIWTHDSYVDPSFVLADKRIVLYGFDETRVYFSVSEKNLLDIKIFPFLFMAQFSHANQLIIMPHSSFLRLAMGMGDLDSSVSIINMTGRSGSTLLCQMVDQLSCTRVISEPWCLLHLNYLYQNGHISQSDNKALLKAGLRMICKKEPGEQFDHLLIKMCPLSGNQFDLFHSFWPKINLFLNDRHPVDKSRSFKKILANVSTSTIFENWGFLWRIIWWTSSTPLDDPKLQAKRDQYWSILPPWGNVEQVAFTHAGLLAGYFKNPGIYKQVILYEELIQDPEKIMSEMLEHMGLDEGDLPKALEALKFDSQSGMQLAQRGSLDKFDLDETTMSNVDRIYQDFGVPMSCKMSREDFIACFDR